MTDQETVLQNGVSPRLERRVVVSTYNTIEMQGIEVIRLVTPFAGPYYYNVLNLGPSTIYIREDADPGPNDEKSVTLPPYTADNLVLIPDGPRGLRLKAGQPPPHPTPARAKITMRLVRG